MSHVLHHCQRRAALGRVQKGLQLKRTFQLELALALKFKFEFTLNHWPRSTRPAQRFARGRHRDTPQGLRPSAPVCHGRKVIKERLLFRLSLAEIFELKRLQFQFRF